MLFRRQRGEADFWNWFASNSDRLKANVFKDRRVLAELSQQLGRVKKGLAFEIGGEAEGGTMDFIVSADGIRERIPDVESLVAAAPPIDGWTIIAFRPRKMDEGFSVQFEGRSLKVDDIYFDSDLNGREIDLKLYIPGFSGNMRDPLIGAAFILLDAAIGEYAVMTAVGEIAWFPLPEDPTSLGLEPLSKLNERFDAIRSLLN